LYHDFNKVNNRETGDKRKIKIGILTSRILVLTLLQRCGKYEISDENLVDFPALFRLCLFHAVKDSEREVVC